MPQPPKPQITKPQVDAAGPGTCRNCETALNGTYCHACGQQARDGETLRGRLAEALTCIFTPGGRFFESLVGLLASPGNLTRTYNAGQRQRFVSPFATLLFAMLVLHGVQWVAGGPDQSLSHEQTVTSALERADRSLTTYAGGEAIEAPNGPAILRGEQQAARSALSEEERRERALSTQFFTDQARQAWNPVAAEPEGFSWARAFAEAIGALPGLFPVMGWLLLPLLLPVMMVLFRRHETGGAVDHSRFLAHALAFSALATAIGTVLILGGAAWLLVATALVLALGAHTALHMRGAYDLSWSQTTWRVAALLAASVLALLILTTGLTLVRLLL